MPGVKSTDVGLLLVEELRSAMLECNGRSFAILEADNVTTALNEVLHSLKSNFDELSTDNLMKKVTRILTVILKEYER